MGEELPRVVLTRPTMLGKVKTDVVTSGEENSRMSESILARVAAGEMGAVDACIKRYSGPVWSLARRLLPREHDAEDAVQEVFLDLWKSADRFNSESGSEMTFVMTIARRRLIDSGRRRARSLETENLPEPDIVPSSDQADEVELRDEAAKVHEAMSRLRPEQRQVLQLSLLNGDSHQRVAERTGMPLGTVKSHARRGLMRVREILGKSGSPTGGDS